MLKQMKVAERSLSVGLCVCTKHSRVMRPLKSMLRSVNLDTDENSSTLLTATPMGKTYLYASEKR